MPTCPPPVYAVGGPYTDAVCGTALCGYTLVSMWWAYPCSPPTTLTGELPGVTAISGASVTVSAPQAKFTLAAEIPAATVVMNVTVGVSPAQTTLTAVIPGFKLSQALPAPGGEIDLLAGPATIRFVGQVFLWPSDCDEVVLVPATSSDLVLTASVCTDLDLEPARSR